MLKFKIYRRFSELASVGTLRYLIEFWKHYMGGLWTRMDENHMFLQGAGIAFSLCLSMIPFVMIIFSVVGNVVPIEQMEGLVTKLIDTVIPYPEYADYTKQVILRRIPGVIEQRTLAGYLGIFGLLFTSTWLFSSMRTVLNNIFGVSDKKSAWVGILRDFGMVILLIFFLVLSTFVLPILNILINSATEIEILQLFRISDFLNFIISLFSIVVMFVLFFLFYYLIPYERLGKTVPVVSALWATLLWEVMRSIFGYYVSNFLSANKLYGAFLLMAVVMFWIFYSSILFVLGAEIGQLFRERQILRKIAKEKDVYHGNISI